jgi:2,3-dihydroxybenzoate decarboxylase
MRKVAVEEHFLMPGAEDYLKRMQALRGYEAARVRADASRIPAPGLGLGRRAPEMIEKRLDLGDGRIAEMDACGIDVMVLSQTTSEGHINPDKTEAIEFARATNDYLASRIAVHPDRFEGFASLPLEDPQAAVKELERAVTELGFKGGFAQGHVLGEYLDAPKFRCVWEALEALDVPIYLHPAFADADNVKIYGDYPLLLGPAWHFGVDTATHVLRIIAGGIFDAFPRAQIMIGHMGEGLPYVLHRLDEGWEPSRWNPDPDCEKLDRRLSEYVRGNVLITTSGNHSNEALACAIAAVGADRILFATDYPPLPMEELVEFIDAAPISEDDREKICHLNAERILRL